MNCFRSYKKRREKRQKRILEVLKLDREQKNKRKERKRKKEQKKLDKKNKSISEYSLHDINKIENNNRTKIIEPAIYKKKSNSCNCESDNIRNKILKEKLTHRRNLQIHRVKKPRNRSNSDIPVYFERKEE